MSKKHTGRTKKQRVTYMDHSSAVIYTIVTIVIISRFDIVLSLIYHLFNFRD